MAASESLLRWAPQHGGTATPRVLVERLKLNDLGLPGDGLGAFWPFGSLIDAFAGDEARKREQFQNDFHDLLADGHPATPHPSAPKECPEGITLCTYQTPWEWDQPRFLNWYRRHRNADDFLEPNGRKNTADTNAIASPLVAEPHAIDESLLARTHGRGACFGEEGFLLVSDNRFNPYRWIGPMNEIQHHEQPSLCVTLATADDGYARASSLFRQANSRERLLLHYDVEVEIRDHRAALGEETIWDYFETSELQRISGVNSQSIKNARRFARGESRFGQTLTPAQQRFLCQWLELRNISPNIQVSLMFNFRERDERYRLVEFMLAAYNQQPIFFFDDSLQGRSNGAAANPFMLDGKGVIPTACEELNPSIVDGGCSGPFAWTRAPVDAYRDCNLAERPMILRGGDYLDLKAPHCPNTRLSGTIDLTAFYHEARRGGYFPGQRGYWGDRWTGFEGDDPAINNPAEEHGAEWLGIIQENHGPFETRLKVNQLDLLISSNGL